MKTILIALITSLAITVNAQEDPNDILGIYLNPNGTAKIEIYKATNGYEGKIVWLSEPNDSNGNPKTDKNNPDKQLRNRPLLDLVTIKSLQFKKDGWSKGELYNPERGSNIAFKVVSVTDNSLIIKVSKGFFTKELTLTKV